jgi:tetratricopeptide (TPR) repeat protein
MYHDIEREPVSFFLREVCQKKLSGHLFVNARDFQITLNFLDGKLANGMSTRFDEKLSVILHLMGRINEEQYNFLSGLHQFSDDQVAGILLDQNFAKKKDIYYARIYQLRRIAISIFPLERGMWIFTAGEPDPPLRETFEIPLEGILVEGARSVDHVSLYAGMWQYGIPVLFSEIPQPVEVYFTDAERDFYAAVQRQGRLSCQELIARLNMVPLDFWRTMLAFHLLGIIEFEKGEAPFDISAEIAALLELNQKLQAVPAGDPGVLGLPSAAPAADVARAREDLQARFAPERFGSAAAPEIKRIARDVCRRLQAPAAGPEAAAPPLVEVRWPGEADRNAEPPLADPQEEEFELAAEFAIEAPPPAAAVAPPPGEVEWILEPDLGEEPQKIARADAALKKTIMQEGPPQRNTLPDEAPPAVAPVSAPPSLRMIDADHEKAWDLLLQSKGLYEKHEYAQAVPLLKKAIKLVPRQGDFYYLLGVCQSEAEVSRNEAEINLKKAIELKSWSADPVYALGVLYRSQGKMNLAERCFQRVKEIAYEHTGASRALVDLRRQKAVGRSPYTAPKKKT